MRVLAAVFAATVLSACGVQASDSQPGSARSTQPAPEEASPPALELPNTYVHEVPSVATGRHYQVWVSVPSNYEPKEKSYPVVFVTDAAYSFPIVRSIRNLLGQRGRNIEDFILVGLPPERGMSSKDSRSRDYTPSAPVRTSPEKYTGARYGEAQAYRDYLERQVLPLVASQYAADMSKTVFIGHSYGGLFGSYVLLTQPKLFSFYILGSPSLWFDNHHALQLEASYSQRHTDLPAKVMMYAGEFETPGHGPRNFKSVDLVSDMYTFEKRLESRGYPSLTIDSKVLADEDHLTIFPALVTRGLLWALPGHGPYTSG